MPAEQVVGVARECAAAGVRALLVISAGFAEAGAEGAARQHELLEVCRDAGMRLVGPNCLGVLNTAPDVGSTRPSRRRQPCPARVGFMSQSGGLGIAIIEAAESARGRTVVVRLGGQQGRPLGQRLPPVLGAGSRTPSSPCCTSSRSATLGGSPGSPGASRRSKPILAVKSGRSAAGARATSSHTGALLSASDVTVDALFEQAGVIRTDTMHELFDVAALLSAQPVPRGDRVVIVTNGGGPGILCADACRPRGVEVAELAPEVRARLAGFLPPDAALGNPIDMIATRVGGGLRAHAADADRRRRLRRDHRDLRPPARDRRPGDVAEAIRDVARGEARR